MTTSVTKRVEGNITKDFTKNKTTILSFIMLCVSFVMEITTLYYAYMYKWKCMCMHKRECMCIHKQKCVYVYKHKYACVQKQKYECVHKQKYTCMH